VTEAGDARGGSGRGRSALGLTAIAAVAILGLVVASVAMFGTADDGRPVVTLPLQKGAAPETPPPQEQPAGALRLVGGNLVADPALIENTALGPLPKIAADGRRPMVAYAPPFNPADKRPRIALVVTGLGISQSETADAIKNLPASVTVAVSPYAPSPQTIVDEARGKGHEVLIEVPMEPFDFPDSDPGPRTLMASASKSEIEQRLVWTLTRSTGYAGAVNAQGGRFLSDAAALQHVIAFLAKRGILWVDVSSAETSATAGVIARLKAPGISGAMRIDAIQMPEAIDEKLLDLEALARQQGWAVGVASAYPVSIARIAAWAQKAQRRGLALAPATAVATSAARPAQ
jgi:polysaccharide deacetylase 2 family uncharacterized protein YibQ